LKDGLCWICKQAKTSRAVENSNIFNTFERARPVHLTTMFFCAISGETPLEPVVSAKSGKVYERRLIIKYITENGTDPITGEKLEESDLIAIKACTFFSSQAGTSPRYFLCANESKQADSALYAFSARYSTSTTSNPYVYPSTASPPPKRMGRPRLGHAQSGTEIQCNASGTELRALFSRCCQQGCCASLTRT